MPAHGRPRRRHRGRPAVPSRSRRRGAILLAGAGEPVLGHGLLCLGRLSPGGRRFRQNVAAAGGSLAPPSDFGRILPVVSRVAGCAICYAELGAFAEGPPRGGRRSGWPRRAGTRAAPSLSTPGVGLLSLRPRGPDARRPLARTGPGASVRPPDIPGLVALDRCGAWAMAYALAGASLRRAAARQAAEQATATHERYKRSHLPLGRRPSEVCRLAGRSAQALAACAPALDHARQHKERGNQACALRLLGDIACPAPIPQMSSRPKPTTSQALALAEELGMRPLQAHCHRGLGTLYATTGQRAAGSHRTLDGRSKCTARWT